MVLVFFLIFFLELGIVDLPAVVEKLLDDFLAGILDAYLPSEIDPLLNEQVDSEIEQIWTGFIYLDSDNQTILDYNLSAPIFLGQGFINFYFRGDIHSIDEDTCHIDFTPDPEIIEPNEEFEIHINYWMTDCAAYYLHKSAEFSNMINDQVKSILDLDSSMKYHLCLQIKGMKLDIKLSDKPSLRLNEENIHVTLPLQPEIYKKDDLWLSLLSDIELVVDVSYFFSI